MRPDLCVRCPSPPYPLSTAMCKSLVYSSVSGPTYTITNSAPACGSGNNPGDTGCSDNGYSAPLANSFVQCPQSPSTDPNTYQVKVHTAGPAACADTRQFGLSEGVGCQNRNPLGLSIKPCLLQVRTPLRV